MNSFQERIISDIAAVIAYPYNFYRFGKIGITSKIRKPLVIRNGKKIYIEEHVSIFCGVRLEVVSSKNMMGRINIGAGTTIEQNCHITAANVLNIGKDCMISANVYISDHEHVWKDINIRVHDQGIKIKKTEIGEGSFIGYACCIMPGVKIGKHCVVGANSVVTHDVPDYSVVAGSPAKIMRKYSVDTGKWEKGE